MSAEDNITANRGLVGATLSQPAQSVVVKDDDGKWTLSLDIDRRAEELVFMVDLEPDYWLAVGLAGNFMDQVDVIQWIAGATGYNPKDSPNSLREEMLLREQSLVHDRISVNGILLEHSENSLRNYVHLDDFDNLVKFTTWRPFNTNGALNATIKIDSALTISFASGTIDTNWEQRIDFGQVDLQLHSSPLPIESSDYFQMVPQGGPINTFDNSRVKHIESHGIWCLILWFPLGFTLLATQRYYKIRWYAMFHLHNLLGLFVTIVTIWSCLQMYAFGNWKPTWGVHSVLGFLALILLFLTGGSGILTSCMMMFYNGDPEWADRDKVYNVAKFHRTISYVMLVWGNAVVTGGTWTYLKNIGFSPWGPIALVEIIFFGALWIIHECVLRRYNRENFKIVEGDELWVIQERNGHRSWTPMDIEEAVEEGDTLVVCDNLVLRTNGYERIHPGGKFVIHKNFGRDIAKFYYGGYSLTNGKLAKTYTHSGRANLILQSMIVGVIEDQDDAVENKASIFAKHALTDDIATFTFKTLDQQAVRNYKNWYQDLGMVAKHFTVSTLALPHIRRQYTICQSMEVDRLTALYKLAKDIIEGGPGAQIQLDESLFNGNDTNQISMTLKNYNRPNGLATQIFDVDLINYRQATNSNALVATQYSTNNRYSQQFDQFTPDGKHSGSTVAQARKATKTAIKEDTCGELPDSRAVINANDALTVEKIGNDSSRVDLLLAPEQRNKTMVQLHLEEIDESPEQHSEHTDGNDCKILVVPLEDTQSSVAKSDKEANNADVAHEDSIVELLAIQGKKRQAELKDQQPVEGADKSSSSQPRMSIEMPMFLQQIQSSVVEEAKEEVIPEVPKGMDKTKSAQSSTASDHNDLNNLLFVPGQRNFSVKETKGQTQQGKTVSILQENKQKVVHRKTIMQRIGNMMSSRPSDIPLEKKRQPSMHTVLRSWTKVAKHDKLVLKDMNPEDFIRRSETMFKQNAQDIDVFNIKGPLGKGLCIEESGVHIAFCAGTGVLVFLDLVSHLMLRSYYKHYVDPSKVPTHMMQIKDDFEFVFFVSMLSMDSEIGLNICEALEKVNRKLGETNFKLTVRISKRWDGMRGVVWGEDFVDEHLTPYAGKIRKVWISGPPVMNQSLDKAFDKLSYKLGVSPHMIDAM